MRPIVFVGDKPSKKNLDPAIPFVGTKSYKTLLEWIWRLNVDISRVTLLNKHQVEWPQFSKLTSRDPHYVFIALGNEASKKLTSLNMEHFKLPHPSGLNRKINDKKYLDKVLKECKNYLKRG